MSVHYDFLWNAGHAAWNSPVTIAPIAARQPSPTGVPKIKPEKELGPSAA